MAILGESMSIRQGTSRVGMFQQAVSCSSTLHVLQLGETTNYISFYTLL